MTSLAATYIKVPVEIARVTPSISLLDPERIKPSPIPKGVKAAKMQTRAMKVFLGVLALVNEIP